MWEALLCIPYGGHSILCFPVERVLFFFKQWCNTVIKLITLSVEVLLSHYSSSCMLMLFLSGELGACLLN